MKTRKKPWEHYGRFVNGIRSGLGIQAQNIIGRWWFGRQCGCTADKQGVEAQEESQSTNNMSSFFPDMESMSLVRKRRRKTRMVVGDTTDSKFVTLKDGTSYRGALYQNVKPCGEGTLVVPRGMQQMNPIARVYDGHFDRGRPTQGETRWENGDIYKGSHDQYGRPHGNGQIFFGGCNHCSTNNATITFAMTLNEKEKSSARSIQRCPRYCSGPWCYQGDFHCGDFQGTGKLIFMDGKIYHGEFHRSMMAGNGTMMYSDGRVVQGWFQLGKPLHQSSHVVEPATLHGLDYVYQGRVVAGYPHGLGVRTKRRRQESQSQLRPKVTPSIPVVEQPVVENGEFHWGIFIVPPSQWMVEILVDLLQLCFDELEMLAKMKAEEEMAAVAEESIDATAALLDLVVDDDEDIVEESEAATAALLDMAEDVEVDSQAATSALLGMVEENEDDEEVSKKDVEMCIPVDAKTENVLTPATNALTSVINEENMEKSLVATAALVDAYHQVDSSDDEEGVLEEEGKEELEEEEEEVPVKSVLAVVGEEFAEVGKEESTAKSRSVVF